MNIQVDVQGEEKSNMRQSEDLKATRVARGFTQEKGVDYNKVFSPVAKFATICLVCALAAIFDLVMDKMNVVIAFLYRYLEEEIYMRQPVGFEVKKTKRVWFVDC